MQISIKLQQAKGIVEKSKCLDGVVSHWTIERLKKNDFDADDSLTINLVDLKKSDLASLAKLLDEVKAPAKTVSTLNTWIENLNNPHNAIITSLQQLEKMLTAAVKDSCKPYWIMKINPDGLLVPYAVSEIKYKGRSRDDEAYVSVKLSAIRIKKDGRWDEEDDIKLQSITDNIYFYSSSVKKVDNDEDLISNFNDDDDDDDNDDDDKPKKKKIVKGDYALSEVLSKKRFYAFN